MKNELSIDELLRDTWLMVVALRNGAAADKGEALYEKGIALVENTGRRLSDAGYTDIQIDNISYAQCALLDETVLNRPQLDNGYDIWMRTPLQARFFNTLQAGEVLYERIQAALQQPVADKAVLTCFHRVLMMGFEGRYRNQSQPERRSLLEALAQQVPSFEAQPADAPLLFNARSSQRRLRYFKSLWFWSAMAVLVVAAVWFGLHYQLQQLLNLWLPAHQG
ncbi:type VI secretion system protein TssL, short form [Biostraticola tofi]|uniref:Type VI secretion system protein ImpK n=1 Tax=Biostraticola tofi TaxID=466109 RepID=A0A4R3Z4Q3_9GAMM|nr:type VI secretion system protein TssL, short form [Biostraticola tofi]TCW00163.1 type VI secretion system protein ImpK [Biostraticola tofi]